MTGEPPIITFVDAEVDGAIVDVRVECGDVVAVQPSLPRAGARVVAANGGALIPGLHDHHLHLLAMAARDRSVDVETTMDAAGFDAMLAAAHGASPGRDSWLRVVGYHELHGPLNLDRLATVAPGRLLRVQHRSGAAWFLSQAGAARLGLTPRDEWWFRLDEHLGEAWADDAAPDLTTVSRRLASFGVTGVTDATPFERAGGFAALSAARLAGELAQHVMVMGGVELAETELPSELELGPVKVVVRDDELPAIGELVLAFDAAHRAGRPVAVHCVSRVATVLALTAWQDCGSRPGDRIEHGSVVPVELIPAIAGLGLTVVTQPGFIAAHGDRYLRDVDPDDVPHLYRCGSLIDAGIGVGGSTDAPFGPADPWLAIRTASDRRTPSGASLGTAEAIPTRRALDAFLSWPGTPGGPPRRVEPGTRADFCLLDGPLARALDDPDAGRVAGTWIGGRPAPTSC